MIWNEKKPFTLRITRALGKFCWNTIFKRAKDKTLWLLLNQMNSTLVFKYSGSQLKSWGIYINTFKTCKVLSGSEEYPSNLEVLREFPIEYTSNISTLALGSVLLHCLYVIWAGTWGMCGQRLRVPQQRKCATSHNTIFPPSATSTDHLALCPVQ